jgi:putative sterol carrier protein
MGTENNMSARNFVNQILPMALEMMKEKTKGLQCVLGLHLLGDGGGEWTLKVNDGIASVEEGVTDYLDCALSVPADDYLALASGQMTPYEAVAKGKIGISGNLGLATRLRSLIKM